MHIVNTLYDTRPMIIHAQGFHTDKRHWPPIKEKFFATPKRQIGQVPDLTIIIVNTGHEALGMVESSLDHLGVPYKIYGHGIQNFVMAMKPAIYLSAVQEAETEFILYVDSRDVLVLDNPAVAVERFVSEFDCDLLFAADVMNWPNLKRFKEFERSLPLASTSRFHFLNAGAWMGRREFLIEFLTEASNTDPVPEAPESEQGIVKQLFPKFYPRMQLDYYCKIFQNIGFVADPIFEI